MKFNKPLHILIDGVDSVGKSTLCEALSKELEIPVTYMVDAKDVFSTKKGNGDAIERLSHVFNTTLAQLASCDFIVDRGYVTSMVYSIVYEREVSKLAYLDEIEKILQPEVFILVNDDLKLLRDRGDEVVPAADFDYIQSIYRTIAEDRGYGVLNVRDYGVDTLVHLITDKIYYKYL